MWVFDATPLIYLAKANQLQLVSNLPGKCYIPKQIYTEVVTAGLEEGYPDARYIEQCIDEDLFKVISIDESPLYARLEQNPSLSDADVAVLVCATSLEATAVMDEAAGRTAAEVEGIETRGTAYLVLVSAKEGHISVAKARETIDLMIENGWYCAPDLYTKLVRKLESFEK
jgi:predicted nucleic acid-binding protein